MKCLLPSLVEMKSIEIGSSAVTFLYSLPLFAYCIHTGITLVSRFERWQPIHVLTLSGTERKWTGTKRWKGRGALLSNRADSNTGSPSSVFTLSGTEKKMDGDQVTEESPLLNIRTGGWRMTNGTHWPQFLFDWFFSYFFFFVSPQIGIHLLTVSHHLSYFVHIAAPCRCHWAF